MRKVDSRPFILELLEERPQTAAELAEAIGLTASGVRRAIVRLHGDRKVHIGGWHRLVGTSGAWSAIWSFGEGEDKPEPKRTKRDKRAANRRYYDKHNGLLKAKQRAKRAGGVVNPYMQLVGDSRGRALLENLI